jgi:hypothetical protein
MLKTNADKTVEFLVEVKPGQPVSRRGWCVDKDGKAFILPAIGGITLNSQIGDSAFGWAADHLEPGVSCCDDFSKKDQHPNTAVQRFSCVGNTATLISGKAKGEEGVVIGQHGGSEHLIVDFPREVKEQMTYDDKIQIKAHGLGLELTDYPDILLFNMDPRLLDRLGIKELGDGRLSVPVTTRIPAACMGSGIGASDVTSGDYDVMTSDPQSVEEFALDKMRFGDIVAILDHDNSFGRAYVQGAVTIGVLIHSDCRLAGHGPGITTIMTCAIDKIVPVIDPKACLADIYGQGTTLD